MRLWIVNLRPKNYHELLLQGTSGFDLNFKVAIALLIRLSMPCFKGLAVSIHTPEGPLPEHSIQKQTRVSRITSYIPVPPPKISLTSDKPEPSSFAISITLLTPGLSVPYSTPKPTSDTPYPKPKLVGSLPGLGTERGKYVNTIGPYEPLTSSPNETIAA